MRRVLVTGGGRGIGRAIALAFAEPGGLVAIAGRTRADLEATAAAIEAKGARALPLVADVSDPASVEQAFAAYRATAAALDVLVNNAGISGGDAIARTDVAQWKRILDTNLFGVYLVSRQAAPLMSAGGRVINISSVLGRLGVAGYTAYCASKHGVIGFTRALALELADRGITVNAICPGWVETEMAARGMARAAKSIGISVDQFRESALGAVPIKRIIQPEEVAELALFLASEGAAAITGQACNICGGQSMD